MKRQLTESDLGRKVKVYYNLHRHCWSVQDYKTRRVIGHCDSLSLKECSFKVSDAGRARVLKEGKKNVHAFVVGFLVSYELFTPEHCLDRQITYNPYKYDSFVLAQDVQTRVLQMPNVAMFNRQVWSVL